MLDASGLLFVISTPALTYLQAWKLLYEARKLMCSLTSATQPECNTELYMINNNYVSPYYLVLFDADTNQDTKIIADPALGLSFLMP